MSNRRTSGGYVGLLVLLIVAGIGIYMWYQQTPKSADGTPVVFEGLKAESAALDVKAAQEARNKKIEQMIEEN